jgi:ABC-2 type transport system ATP-binding protein
MSIALQARGLGKRYAEGWALRDCAVDIPSGRVVGLVGPNGAGKTTLLHLAVGLLAPTAGEVSIFGANPRGDVDVLSRIGFVAQETPLYHGFRVDEMLTLGRRLNRRFDVTSARKRLEHLEIALGQRVGDLSGGQRAQVALALALAKGPELLLLDEPVASLDPLARREFLQALMAAAAEREVAVLLSSHLLSDLERTCDYLILLVASEVRLAGDIDELLAEHKVLVGARRSALAVGGVDEIVTASHSERQTTLLVRTTGVIHDPSWDVHDVELEELVLAYMGESSVRRQPDPLSREDGKEANA